MTAVPEPPAPVGASHAAVLVFVSSAAVLVLEILAGRLLAPYSGVTLETFTAIIGTILGGIAVGSWAGGRLADRIEPRRLLGPELAVGGVLAMTMPPLVAGLGPVLARGPVGLVLVVVVAGLPAAAVLSAVTPTVVKMRLRALDETGSVVGRLSAVGTAGAIVGTFVTGFVLVAQLPSARIVVALGMALTVWGAVLWWRSAGASTIAVVVALAVLVAASALAVGVRCDVETAYYCVRVEVDAEGGRSLWLDTLRHAYVDPHDPAHLEFAYTRMFAAVIEASTDGPLAALHVGGGGLTMPRWLEHVRPGSTNVVLELDPGVVEVAAERLGYAAHDTTSVLVGDARLGLDEVADERFDVVVGDAFGGVAAPWHLATREVAEEIAAVSAPSGTYVVNVIDRRSMSFVRAQAATLGAVFPHVIAIGHGGTDWEDTSLAAGGNVVLAAGRRPFDLAAIVEHARTSGLAVAVLAGEELDRYVGDAMVLTDAYAPVDQLFDRP